jgi:ribosomal protein S6--L-glutamate ligase
MIILPQTCPEKLFTMCTESNASLFPDYRARFDYPGKTGQNILFKKFDLPHPATFLWNSVNHFLQALNKGLPHEYPFLLKEDKSHESEGIHFIKEPDDIELSLKKIMKKSRFREMPFISQEFIPAQGNTLRVVIMADSGISYWKRGIPGHEIVSISNGAMVDKKWRPDLQEKGILMAERLKEKTGINLAAVDFIFNHHESDPEPVFLEINYYFGRTGLGGTINYYNLLFRTVTSWMDKNGFDSQKVNLV